MFAASLFAGEFGLGSSKSDFIKQPIIRLSYLYATDQQRREEWEKKQHNNNFIDLVAVHTETQKTLEIQKRNSLLLF